jgi:hypothetical protein
MWNHLKNNAIISALGTLFSNCSIIQLMDWATTDGASDFWDELYEDVIKPLNKRDFEFIFHLGDVTKKHAFEVEEILDIMGDYSSFGRVTLVLNENEADILWNKLNGPSQETIEKYRFLFNTMNIDMLLISKDIFPRNCEAPSRLSRDRASQLKIAHPYYLFTGIGAQ